VIATALGSALAAATSSVLQHRSARSAERQSSHRLIGHLVTRPIWLAGLAVAVVGLILHAAALVHGELAIVQPLLISGVLFALPVSVVLEGSRPSTVEWLWALALVGGLTVFLLSAKPSPAVVPIDADILAWSTVFGSAVVGLVALVGLRWPHGHAAALLGAAAGIGYGLTAALLKQVLTVGQTGIGHLFTDWPLYALAGVGLASVSLTQLAYHSGPLASSMPAITVTDPAASVLIGVIAFKESLADDPLAVTLQIAGFVTMIVATVQLARRNTEGSTHPMGSAIASEGTDDASDLGFPEAEVTRPQP